MKGAGQALGRGVGCVQHALQSEHWSARYSGEPALLRAQTALGATTARVNGQSIESGSTLLVFRDDYTASSSRKPAKLMPERAGSLAEA